MSLATAVAPEAKPRRRPVARATKGQDARPQKVSLYLSPKVAKALGVHALMTGQSQSALAESVLAEALRRFVVQDRAKPSVGGESDGPAMMVEGSDD